MRYNAGQYCHADFQGTDHEQDANFPEKTGPGVDGGVYAPRRYKISEPVDEEEVSQRIVHPDLSAAVCQGVWEAQDGTLSPVTSWQASGYMPKQEDSYFEKLGSMSSVSWTQVDE